MKSNKSKSSPSTTKRSRRPNESLTFFPHFLGSSSKRDHKICTCRTYNRNTNAFHNENDSPQQLYPHMRKVYNTDTDLLEHVYILMSTNKPEGSINEEQEPVAEQEETVAQRRCRRTRVSKQRAKALITEYCARKIPDHNKCSTNKRNYSSLCVSSFR